MFLPGRAVLQSGDARAGLIAVGRGAKGVSPEETTSVMRGAVPAFGWRGRSVGESWIMIGRWTLGGFWTQCAIGRAKAPRAGGHTRQYVIRVLKSGSEGRTWFRRR